MEDTKCGAGLDPRLVGDPVDTLTGAVIDSMLDFRLTGPLELRWTRYYDSSKCNAFFSLGRACAHEFDRTLSVDAEGFQYEEAVRRTLRFPPLRQDGDECAFHGFTLQRLTARRYLMLSAGAAAMEFEFAPQQRIARLGRLLQHAHQVRFVYDADLRLVGIDDSAGRRLNAQEDEHGRLVRLAVEGTPTTSGYLLIDYQYDDNGNLVRTANAEGHGYKFSYDEGNRLVVREGRKGFRFYYNYDERGRCIRSMGDDRLHGVALSFDIPGRLTRVTRPDRGVWTYTFDGKGALEKIQGPLGGVRKFIRDALGRIALELDQNQNVSRIVYDAAGAAIARIGPLGYRTELPTDPDALDPQQRRIAANAAEYHYGLLRNVTQIKLPSPAQAALAPCSSSVRKLLVTRIEPPQTAPQYSVRPLAGRWWPEPKQGWVFNDFGKLVTQTDQRGNARHWNYDASGNMCAYQDFDGGRWSYDTGTWHFVRGITDPLGAQIRFTYTTAGEIASCTDAGGTETVYEHDLNDHVVRISRHGATRETYQRDAAGNLLAKYAADGRELLRFEIGPGNRPIRRHLACGDEHSFTYDEAGRPLTAQTRKDAVTLAYDDRGQQIIDKRNGQGLEISLDVAGGALTATFLERFVTQRKWLDAGTLELTDPGGLSHRIKIGPHGIMERTCGTHGIETSQFDALGRCLFKRVERPNGSDWTRRFHWSGESELRLIEDDAHGDVRHDYDAAHRLRHRVVKGAVEDYSMDAAGNLLQQPGLRDTVLGDGNRLKDANGEHFGYNDRDHIDARVHANGSVRYVYDSRDLLVRVESDVGSWEAEYDALGRRTRKRWNNATTEYFWNGEQLLAELQPTGQLRIFVYADPLALSPMLFLDYASADADTADCRRYFVFADQVGAPRLIEDESGDVVWRAQINPFGMAQIERGARIEYNLRFPGHYFDAELQLHCNGRRYYDPTLGRYLQSDPWGLAGGYNVYAYRANPLHAVDVRGLGEEGQSTPRRPADDEESKPLHERVGWVDSYGEQKKVTGDGSVDRDHQPSKLAIKKAIHDDIKRRVAAGEMVQPNAAQMKKINDRIDKEAMSVVVDREKVHKRGPTHGDKNKEQSEIDKRDLGAAATRDADAMVANTAAHDPDNLPATQAAAEKIKEQTHESIMEKNRAIVDDVMDSSEE